jgi:protein involved in temperature-dependent protein secretion
VNEIDSLRQQARDAGLARGPGRWEDGERVAWAMDSDGRWGYLDEYGVFQSCADEAEALQKLLEKP